MLYNYEIIDKILEERYLLYILQKAYGIIYKSLYK